MGAPKEALDVVALAQPRSYSHVGSRRSHPPGGRTLLGNTALAATIEAEELARFAVPARRGRPEIGLGSIAGTIVHFVALNAGIIALVKPLTRGSQTTRFYLPVAVASPAIFAAVLVTRKQLGRIEGAGLTALYVAYVAVAIAVSS
jgi:cation:H+ antiporter